jgi:phosphate starvation-inducible membrane PsiE
LKESGDVEKRFERLESRADVIGNMLVRSFHLLALFAIGGATVWSAFAAFLDMVAAGRANIGDILLLFIYLELGAMVGIYFKTKLMPVRFLIYVAITALTRLMIDVISTTHDANLTVIIITSAIFLLALAELVLRFGAVRFPISEGPEEITDRASGRGKKKSSASA